MREGVDKPQEWCQGGGTEVKQTTVAMVDGANETAAPDHASGELKKWCRVGPWSQYICDFITALEPIIMVCGLKKDKGGGGGGELAAYIHTHKHTHTVHLHAAVFERMTNEAKTRSDFKTIFATRREQKQ